MIKTRVQKVMKNVQLASRKCCLKFEEQAILD